MRLLANMVARNEADRYLIEVLSHLSGYVDQIVFTDDASTDDTPEIALGAGAKVRRLDDPLFTRNEGLLRNIAWQHLCDYAEPGDWILAIDADELMFGLESLQNLINQSRYDVLGITFYHMWNPAQYRTDKAWRPTIGSRLFRFVPGGEFVQRKMACGSEPTYVQELIRQGKFLPHTPLKMMHLGYLLDADKVAKYKRYMELDGGDFHSRAHLESILDPNPTLVDWSPS